MLARGLGRFDGEFKIQSQYVDGVLEGDTSLFTLKECGKERCPKENRRRMDQDPSGCYSENSDLSRLFFGINVLSTKQANSSV